MAYGDFTEKSLDTAVFDLFGLHVSQFPEKVILYPFGFENFVGKNWKEKATGKTIQEIEIPDKYFSQYKNYLIKDKEREIFICMGGRGASDFADSSVLLCNIPAVKEILFIGNGAGVGDNIRSKDIHIPRSCSRYEQITNFLVDQDFIAESDSTLSEEINNIINEVTRNDDIIIHRGNHATVPFFYSETEDFLKEIAEKSITIDMEMSVIYTFAKIYNKKSTGILRIGDLPLQGEEVWKTTDLRRPELNRRIKDIFLACILAYGFER
jgi:purine-nucleoside phosphorylase